MSSTGVVIVLVVAVVIITAAFVMMVTRKRRSQRLRQQFGPEYGRVVRRPGDASSAERVLEFRQNRRQEFEIRPLSPTDRSSFRYRWNEVQSRFVNDPKGAVTMAESLLNDLMQARGYPIADFEQQSADISIDRPIVVENYRAAYDIAMRHRRGQASTQDLRNAMIHYRVLFQELLDDNQPQKKEA